MLQSVLLQCSATEARCSNQLLSYVCRFPRHSSVLLQQARSPHQPLLRTLTQNSKHCYKSPAPHTQQGSLGGKGDYSSCYWVLQPNITQKAANRHFMETGCCCCCSAVLPHMLGAAVQQPTIDTSAAYTCRSHAQLRCMSGGCDKTVTAAAAGLACVWWTRASPKRV